jgi:hypothetical protein
MIVSRVFKPGRAPEEGGVMTHLSVEQMENYAEGQDPELDAHVTACPRCQRELAAEQRLARALMRLERLAPSPEFAARLDRALARAESATRGWSDVTHRPSLLWTGVAALLASALLVVFAYQTVVAFQDGGALDFVSLFASRPDLLSTYPIESLNALIESLPLVEFLLTLGLLVIAVVLGEQFMTARSGTAHVSHQ